MDDNAVVWSYEVATECNTTLGVYYNTRAEFNGLPLMLQEGLHKGMERSQMTFGQRMLITGRQKPWFSRNEFDQMR